MTGKYGRHQTVAKELKATLRWLESLVEVERIIIGISEACRHHYPPGFLRVGRASLPAGLKVKAYSGFGVTDIYLHVQSRFVADLIARIDRHQA